MPIQQCSISQHAARHIWIHAQKLDTKAPFGGGPEAVAQAITHLGYVQIDTINVIERCHHHILYNRIPTYKRTDLHTALSDHKSIFEYWTHALSFVPTAHFEHFAASMKAHRNDPTAWSAGCDPAKLRAILRRIKREGPLSIADIKDDELVEKSHAWGSRKPSKRALQEAFYNGQVVISERRGMLKFYELTARHFGWDRFPRAARQADTYAYLLDRALTSQGLVCLNSICYLNARQKPAINKLIEQRVRAKQLVPVTIDGFEGVQHWATPQVLEQVHAPDFERAQILSPFDPLIIQRKRTSALFNYDHIFEVYVPKEKRKFGYFTLPVLMGDEIVAAIDLKADRKNQNLLIQAWHWVGQGNAQAHQSIINTALDEFSAFQFGTQLPIQKRRPLDAVFS